MGLGLRARSWLLLCGLLVTAVASPARAAEMTRVASSFDVDNPFDLDLWVGFERTQERGKITREWHQNGSIQDVLELRYTKITQSLPIRLAIGLYHDLEIHAAASMVFNVDQNYVFPAEKDDLGNTKVTQGNSTIYNNCVGPRGGLLPGCDGNPGAGPVPIFTVPGQGLKTYRAGFSDVLIGLSWAPFSDERDDTKPKWVLTFDYTGPVSRTNKPWLQATDADRGFLGDGAHRFTFSTAISKRLGAIDPYLKLTYTLPIPGNNSISNCENPNLPTYSENCNTGPWTHDETGLKPPHIAGFLFGAEFYPYDNPTKKQRVAIEMQFGLLYISEGRYWNEMSDALGKLLYTEEYLHLGGSFAVNARPVEYVQLRLAVSLYTDTEHLLTNEPVGKDLDGACRGDKSTPCVDLDNHNGEINPNFDFRYDMPGRRFRISEVTIFQVMATGVVNF
jgi:hypothetical protein